MGMELKVHKAHLMLIGLLVLWLPVRGIYYLIPGRLDTLLVIRFVVSTAIILTYLRMFRNKKIELLLVAFALSEIVSALINYTEISKLFFALEYAMYIIAMYMFLYHLKERGWEYFFDVIKLFSVISIFLTAVDLLKMILADGDVEALGVIFFIGSRAESVQMMLALVVLCVIGDWIKCNRVTILTYMLIITSFVVAVFFHSGQGLSMFFVTVLLYVFFAKKEKAYFMLTSPLFLIGSFGIANYLVVSQVYMNINYIVYYITQVLKKDATISGRDIIYKNLPGIFSSSPIWGYGYRNTVVENKLSSIAAGYNSAHNSLFELLLQVGLVGTVVFVLLLWQRFAKLRKEVCKVNLLFSVSLIAYIVGGVVSLSVPSWGFWLLLMVLSLLPDSMRFDRQIIKNYRDCA